MNNPYLISETLLEEEQEPLGRYGHMRDEYLRKNRNLKRTLLFARGELDAHLREVDRQAWERMEVFTEGLLVQAASLSEKGARQNDPFGRFFR